MANVYVYSGAAGAGTGADWANAYTTLAAAFVAKAAGDDFWVADDHAESQASAMALTSPGTAASPCRVFCVRRTGGSVPPVSADLRTTATITTTGGNGLVFTGGKSTVYDGITFSGGSGGVTSGVSCPVSTSAPTYIRFRNCALKKGGTGAGFIDFFVSGSGQAARFDLINTTLQFGNVGDTFAVGNAVVRWMNTLSAIAGATIPTNLIGGAGGNPGRIEMIGVDLSAIGSGKNLVDLSQSGCHQLVLIDCKLGAGVGISSGSVNGHGGATVRLVNCDSADTLYRYYEQTYQGTLTHETTIVRTGGASDGVTPVSVKAVSTANSKRYSPLECEVEEVFNETVGNPITVTVEIVNDGTTLKDDEVWLEVEYLGTLSYPLGNYANDGPADPLAAGTNQPTSSVTWTTTGLTSPVKQYASVTFTPQHRGVIRPKLMVAKASQTLYYCPWPVLS